jgi:ubiquinone/menaquinone biosynthesis C-methylase UbiE/DNA-binding transcriptional ArsR family regulator
MNTYIVRVTATLTQVFKALSDPTRLRLSRVLCVEELSVGELGELLDLPQSTISRHLAVLRDAGVATDRRQGTRAFYRLRGDFSAHHKDLLATLEAGVPEADADVTRIDEIIARRVADPDTFDSLASGWESLRASQVAAIVTPKAVAALVPADLVVVDIGCGTGTTLPDLAGMARTVHAVDISPRMLEQAKARAIEESLDNVEFHRSDMSELPLPDDSADAALLALVLRHSPRPAKAIHEAGRVLREGGKIVVVDFVAHDDERFRTELDHQWLGFARDDLAGWFDAAGFRLLRWEVLPSPDKTVPATFIAEGRNLK